MTIFDATGNSAADRWGPGRDRGLGSDSAAGTSRRVLLRQAVLSSLALSLGKLVDLGEASAQEAGSDPWLGGIRLGELAFQAEPQAPPHSKIHSGLDARLYTDLSLVRQDRLITPIEEFYIRTAAPDRLDFTRDLSRTWRIRLGGLVRRPVELARKDLDPLVEPQGTHLMECAGNSRVFRFGLMSTAQWSGVRLDELLARAEPLPRATSVRIEGFDDHSRGSTTSALGCGWIFTLGQLKDAGAFLATHMNGRRLTPDHGYPLRLMVPGWYGCCCVKWVQSIELVGDDRPATSQMQEFALRTHQDKVLERAAEYRPATVVRSALPIRVEQWRVAGKTKYRVVGIDWGGDRARSRLRIRFRPSDPYEQVDTQPTPTAGKSWSIWSHAWSPVEAGPYLIQLSLDDRSVAAPRLDAGHYIRGVKVTDA